MNSWQYIKYTYTFVFILLSSLVFSQSRIIDSLTNELNNVIPSKKAELLSQIADSYLLISPEISEKYLQKALVEANINTNKNLLPEIYRIYGIIKYYQNEIDSSFYYYYKSVKIAEELGDVIEVASGNTNIAALLSERGDYGRAIQYLFVARQIFRDNNIKENEAITLNNIGLIYQKFNKQDSALYYLKESLIIKKELNNLQGQAYTLINMAIIEYRHRNNFINAKKNFDISCQILEDNNNIYAISLLQLELGNYYNYKRDFINAKKYYILSNESAKKIQSYNIQKLNNKSLYEIFTLENDVIKAHYYYKEYIACKDTLENEAITRNIDNLKLKYETEKKEQNINSLMVEKKLKDAKIILQKKIIIIFIALMLATLMFLIIFYFQSKIQKRANKDLTHRNLEVMQSENELIEAKAELETIIENMQMSDDKALQILKQSKLNIEDKKEKELLAKIYNSFNNDEIFLNNELTINEFSKIINSNKTYISHIINNNFKMNFSSYVNHYRVKYARILLAKPKYQNYTIEAIAGKSGFKSVTAFNKAFKKYTGLTPSKFTKNIFN